MANSFNLLVPPARLERAAHGLGIRCSVHLSYGGIEMCLAVEKYSLPVQPERSIVQSINHIIFRER